MEDLYGEKFKSLGKEVKTSTGKWKDISGSQIGRIDVVKMTVTPKVIHRFNTIPIKIPPYSSEKLIKSYPKMHIELPRQS